MNSTPSTSQFFFHEGELMPIDDPVIRLGDSAIVQGNGLFETIAAYSARPFMLREHFERLSAGGIRLQLAIPPLEEIEEAFHQLIAANALDDESKIRLRITVTGGVEKTGVFYEASSPPSHPREANAVVVPYTRNDRGALTGMKTISYGENVPATLFTKERGADEGIWPNTIGNLCEGTWSNVFVRIDGEWLTPPLESGCLPGVTRATVLQLAKAAGIDIHEDNIPMPMLDQADAAFLTSSIREIQPVRTIDGKSLPTRLPEEISLLQKAYRELTQSL